MEELREEVLTLLQDIMSSRKGCCGSTYIYTSELGVNRIDNLYARVSQPSNKVDKTESKECSFCNDEGMCRSPGGWYKCACGTF